jgi:hypothetical protein
MNKALTQDNPARAYTSMVMMMTTMTTTDHNFKTSQNSQLFTLQCWFIMPTLKRN